MNKNLNPSQQTFDFITDLIKSNEQSLKTIDDDKEMTGEYDKYQMDMVRMQGELKDSQRSVQEVMAMLFDDQINTTREDDKHKWIDTTSTGTGIPPMYLRRAGETETPRLIKNLRRLQLTQFSEAASSRKYGREQGFALKFKNPEYRPSEDERQMLLNMELKLQELIFFPAGSLYPSLSQFLGAAYEDFFDLDDITIRIRRDATNYPIGIHLEDPTLWFPTVPKVMKYPRHDQDLLEDIGGIDGAQIDLPEYQYLMIKNDIRMEAATMDNIRKHHFFVRSDFAKWRHGYSIMEQALRTTTILINAMTFNASNFSTNKIPPGLLALKGGFTNQIQVEKVKKLLWASMSGAANQRRIPIVGLPEGGDASWISMHSSAKEMEFYTGITFYTSVIYALSGTSPNESGLASFQDALKGNRLNDDSKDGTWKQSRDNGLNTFLNNIEQVLNSPMSDGRNIWQQITGLDVKCEFKGLAAEDLQTKNTVNRQRIEIATSVNDIRKEEGKDPFEFKIGDVNIFDVPGFANGVISGAITQSITLDKQQDFQKEQAQQQMDAQASMQQPQAPEDDGGDGVSDEDQALLQKYSDSK